MLRRLTQQYSAYKGRVEMLGIALDSTEPVSELTNVASREAYPFPAAAANPEMVTAYQVLIRSPKIAVDANGAIANPWGYGLEPSGSWRKLFASLVSS